MQLSYRAKVDRLIEQVKDNERFIIRLFQGGTEHSEMIAVLSKRIDLIRQELEHIAGLLDQRGDK